MAAPLIISRIGALQPGAAWLATRPGATRDFYAGLLDDANWRVS